MPSALIVGGFTAVGRHLVQYIVENKLAYPIRVIDKSITQLAFLSPKHEAAFQQVECVQSSMLTPGMWSHLLLT
jgi:hypothetical protein